MNDHRTGPLSAAIAEAEVQTFSFADEKGGGVVEYRCGVDRDGEIRSIDLSDGYQSGALRFGDRDGAETLIGSLSTRHDDEKRISQAQEFISSLSKRADMIEQFDILAGRLASKLTSSRP